MWAFFAALFGAIWIGVLYANENKKNRAYQTRVNETKSRSDKWFARVNNGPLHNAAFHEKLQTDQGFCKTLFDECNAILDSIPEMNGIRLKNQYDYKARRLMEMMYNARTGDISFMWFSGWIRTYELTEGLTRKPSPDGCAAFIEWYQTELRKNGYQGATILPVDNGYGFVVAWRFTDGATDYQTIKQTLFIK